MGVASPPDLITALRQLSLLEADQLAALDKPPLAKLPPRDLARELVKLGWLTPFQVNQLLNGRGKELVLGEYVLLETLGKGGMGQVYKARQRRLKRLVAFKVIRKEFLSNATTVQRFLREAESAARLTHPNIVTVYDAGEAQGMHYLAMEFIDGTNLGDLLKNGPMPVATACDYVRQAALGLQHAFEQGMVHRDLKPHNLMLTKQGTVKVLDFGLARLVQQTSPETRTEVMTQQGSVLGTPDYIAPEQAMNARTIDIRADIYSLGCTLYHLLAGRPPFQGESLTETLLKHHLEEPTRIEELRKGLPEGLPDLIRTMMAKKPDDRYQTPAEAADALAAFGNAPATSSTHLTPPRRASATPNKRSFALPLLIGAAALGVFFVITISAIAAYFLLRFPTAKDIAQTPTTSSKDKDRQVSAVDKARTDRDKRPPDADKRPPEPEPKGKVPPDLSKLRLLFQDDFSQVGGFPVRKDQGHESGYANGRYFIRISDRFAGWHNGKTYSDFACKVVGKVSGPPVAAWGLCLACPQDKNRGILVGISREGKLAVMPSPFAPPQTAPTGPNIIGLTHKAIKPGDQSNELLVVTQGKQLEVFVNGESVLQPLTLDKELNSAVTCLMVYTQKQEGRAEFENLSVWSLANSNR
jgi:serine/threonine protein kinase